MRSSNPGMSAQASMHRLLHIPKIMVAMLVGPLVYTLLPGYRTRLLSKWPEGGPQSATDKLIYQAVLKRVCSEYYNFATPTSRRETLKDLCMGQESGVVWAEDYASRGFPTEETAHIPMFHMLEECLSAGQIKTVHQVACGSGREIAYFAQRHPEMKFFGSDMDDAIVAASRERWQQIANLSFVVVRLDRLDASEQEYLRSDLVYASGGLQYLDEHALRRFLCVLLPLAGRILFNQPLAIDFLMREHSRSTPRGNFSWNHPYTQYLVDEGWLDVHYEIGFIEESFWAKNVSVSALSR